ncbi:MAG: hypothetical protein ABJF10_16595 [Chthoniobacter sp.]|uniref:hypothetical protein n=1 Tax=Chthoniobacter sp. TaxID=2510640 RepID=UPI0032A3EDF0
MNALRLIVVILICSMLSCVAGAQTVEQLRTWEKSLAEKSVSEIASQMNKAAPQPWPNVGSQQYANTLADKERTLATKGIGLVQALHMKVKRDFVSDGQKPEDAAKTYLSIAEALESAGGYSNLVLADSVRRLAVFRLSEALVRFPPATAGSRAIIDSNDTQSIDLRALLERLCRDDLGLAEHRAELAKIEPSQNMFAAFEIAGLGDASSLGAVSFTHLIELPSAPGLVMRIAATQQLYKISLRGLLAFVEKGGTYKELNPADITAFQRRMNGEEKTFKYPPLSIRYLGSGSVKLLFDLHKDAASRDGFLKAALD